MEVVAKGTGFGLRITDAPPVSRHKPSVDVLFHSAASVVGAKTLAIILTGMGRDGADGMLALHRAGAFTIAQDEASCVVYGMPKEAVRLGGVDRTVALSAMPQTIIERSFL